MTIYGLLLVTKGIISSWSFIPMPLELRLPDAILAIAGSILLAAAYMKDE
jgi:hypothetical protein